MLPAEIVYRLASILTLSDGCFLVGGQALNIWAERYSFVPELADFGPYTSKDIDYFGHRNAAAKLADALKGRLRIPPVDDASPQSAVVEAMVGEHRVEIDFLTHVLGVEDVGLKKAAVNIVLKVRTSEGVGTLRVPVMHPFHCLQSRAANVVTLKRGAGIARRQLEASSIVLREFISEMLAEGAHREATDTLGQVFEYLRSDPVGRIVHRAMTNDPAAILDHFAQDDRIDLRYRENTLANMRREITDRRNI